MARIIDHLPEPNMIEICSYCKTPIALVTKFDCDGSPYPACATCGDCIDNPWNGWKPDEKPEDKKPNNPNRITLDGSG